MLLNHSRIGMTEIASHDGEGHPPITACCPSVTQLMKAYRGINLRSLTCGPHRPLLVARFPLSIEHWLSAGATSNNLPKEILHLLGKNDVAAIADLLKRI